MNLNYNIFNVSSQNFDILFNSCPDGVVCKDRNLNYISINNSYRKLFDISDNVIGSENIKKKFLSKKNLKLVDSVEHEIKENKYSINYIITTKDAKILNVMSFPIIIDKNFEGIISVIRDITQEENLKEEFVNKHFRYLNNEKRLQAQRDTFVASISHDLKNPTIAQIRVLELLLKGSFGELNPEQKELLCMVLDSCRYMNGMLSSLLVTYRNYGGAVKLNFEKFNFMELINECVSEMIYVAKDKSVRIKINSDNSDLYLNADKIQIKRVIMNLLSNGIKYAFKDTDLNLYISNSTDFLSFSFENKSPYIPEDEQKSIFARYISFAGIHKELGVGLGLYASKKIIEGHSGQIYVKSYKDNRNIFGFEIPINQISSQKEEILF